MHWKYDLLIFAEYALIPLTSILIILLYTSFRGVIYEVKNSSLDLRNTLVKCFETQAVVLVHTRRQAGIQP